MGMGTGIGLVVMVMGVVGGWSGDRDGNGGNE
jgi:hypothetical protein